MTSNYRREIRTDFPDRCFAQPRMTVFNIIANPLQSIKSPRAGTEERVVELMRQVGLRPEYMRRYLMLSAAVSVTDRLRALALNPSGGGR
jgi:ABC-type dipeptide/oligopeptide/nickel transport system ATPase subunit